MKEVIFEKFPLRTDFVVNGQVVAEKGELVSVQTNDVGEPVVFRDGTGQLKATIMKDEFFYNINLNYIEL